MAEPRDSLPDQRRFGPALMLGTNMAVGMAVFAGLGYYADRKMGGGIRWTLCGMFLGLFYCGYEVWKVIRELNAGSGARPSPPPDTPRPPTS